MPEPRQIIEYARAAVARESQIRREGDELTITIPPPPFWRMTILALLRISTLLTLFAIAAAVFYLLDTHSAASPLIFPCALLPAVILTLLRITRVALAGSQPTVIRASPLGLQIAPRGMTFLNCNWLATELIDLEVRQGGIFPLFAKNIHLRVVFTGERIESYSIPWNGSGALANIEDNLRDILALPRTPK